MIATTEQKSSGILALPVSSGQQRFWFLDQLKPGDPSLNVAVRFELNGPLEPPILQRALNEIVRRHEILRSTFEMLDGYVVQLVAPVLAIHVPVDDLRSLSPSTRQARADRAAEVEAREPFSLAIGPLMRARLLRVNDDEHILLITIHHIVSDGWSIGLITDELGPIYEAYLEQRPSPLPELEIQYADYTIWEEQNRDPAAWSEAEAYWKNQLDGMPRFEIMPDRPRGNGSRGEGNIVSRLLPVCLTNCLRDLSREHETTLFMTMLSVLAALLSRYTGETDVVVGSQIAGRNTVEVEPLIGPFINTLVLRTDTSGDPVFPEILARVKQVVLKALEHQQYPLEKVAEVLRLERNLDSTLLFQVNFIYQRDFVHPWEYGGVRMRPIPSKSPGAMYDLNIFLVERAEGWRVSCEYNAGLYYEQTVQQLLEHFEHLARAICGEPGRPISDYALLSAAEEHRILHDWNDTSADYPRQHCLYRLFEEQVERSPAGVAAVCGRESIKYAQLNARANQLARYLQGRGLGPETLAGICVDRSINMLVAVLAVLKTGAAYVPLDPSFPADRLAFMAVDAGLKLLITEEGYAGLINTEAPTVLIDAERSQIARYESANLPGAANGESLAYLIYTSGSTGQPKGVAVHHQALVNLLWAILKQPGIGPGDTMLAVTTLSFDIAGLELFAPLLAGARVVIATRAAASDAAQLRTLLAESGATVLQATPATWRMLIEAGWQGLPSLKMLCGGEALTPQLATALLNRGGELWNMYGPTETTIWSSWTRVRAANEPITIGRPAPNQSFYVLDSKLKPVPSAIPGELCIGGDGVARGYHNRPDLTADRFVPNPYAPGRLYRTGDRARYRQDGSVEVLGRMDSQVKIRGFRIELGEVEAALLACPGIQNAAVIVREDGSGMSFLAGYFVPEAPDQECAERVRIHLKQRLPEYMIPTRLIPLLVLPKTPNGKLDRKALPEPDALRKASGNTEEVQYDALETTLIGIWESVLGIRPINRKDNFFEIGGHSVLAARMFGRMEKVLGKSLPLATLFQGPTIEKLAALLRDSGWTPPWSSLVPIRTSGSQPPFFFVHPIGGNVLSFAGFASHFDADQPVYGLQARGLDGKTSPNTSIELMAADYVHAIRAVQPDGPYYIGGFSAGGIVAFEMARVLQAAGERVDILALLDTKIESRAESSLAASTQRLSRLVRTIHFNIHYSLQIGPGPFLAAKVKNTKMRSGIRLWLTRKALGLNPGVLDAEEAFLLALRTYTPTPLKCNAILFRAEDELLRLPDPSLGWSRLIDGQVDIQLVSGDHDTILQEPHIGRLARLLDSFLRDAYQPASRAETTSI